MSKTLIIFLAAEVSSRENSRAIHRLVSDIPGVAEHVDANLENPWGLAAGGASPFWMSNNPTAMATVYDGDGTPFPAANPLVVTTPAPAGSAPRASSPTGQTFNDTGSFELSPGNPATFLFCAEDGTIPNAIDILAGGTVTWTNGDGFAHHVCAIHPFMRGKVVVQ